MNILLVYATNSGSTFEVANLISGKLTEKGHQVDVKNVTEVNHEAFNGRDLVLLGSPSWEYEGNEGYPHQDFVALMKNTPDGASFPQVKFAIFGLGDKNYQIFCGAVEHLTQYLQKVQGQIICEPLRIDGYYNDMAAGTEAVNSWLDNQLLPKLG